MLSFFRKYHKWIGIIASFFLLLFALSGILLNHRETISPIDVSRTWLPEVYRYSNWNNASLKGSLRLSPDSILIYGNIGIWLTDSSWSKFEDFNTGFPKGIDNRKISKLVLFKDKTLVAGTQFGLFHYDKSVKAWSRTNLPVRDPNVTDLLQVQDSLLILTRSELLVSKDLSAITPYSLPPPEDFDNKIGLFKTLWVIHSGEIYGLAGKLLVDLVALIFIFLMITGLILFLKKNKLRSKGNTANTKNRVRKNIRWNLKWHNKVGWITAIVLILTTCTGMFLRPPLLALIGYAKVGKIPYTSLDTPNPWYDILRRISYIPEKDLFILASSEGFYYSDDQFKTKMKKFTNQPPASIMGVTVFERYNEDFMLVGSFEGLFAWDFEEGTLIDYISRTPYQPTSRRGSPVGEFKISGYSKDYNGEETAFDYGSGAIKLQGKKPFIGMPDNILQSTPMPLWNLALEVHTARIYQPLIGNFYILVVPLSGLLTLFIIISGFIVWYKSHRKKSHMESPGSV
ncbi:MAG: PepSY-associated TM helix domain-containing protein [Bacteroidales bacterium]